MTTPVGGISIRGWDEPGVLVRARLEATAPSHDDAEALASQLQTTVVEESVAADGPIHHAPRESWSVTFGIFVPRAVNLSLTTKVGGISIADVNGTVRFNAGVGGVSLVRLAGDVQGVTVVGGVSIVLGGDHWEGQTLSVKTNVGGIDIGVPTGYSAHFALTTGLGRIMAGDFGVSSAHTCCSLGGNQVFDTGSSGATVAAATGVGGISVRDGSR